MPTSEQLARLEHHAMGLTWGVFFNTPEGKPVCIAAFLFKAYAETYAAEFGSSSNYIANLKEVAIHAAV